MRQTFFIFLSLIPFFAMAQEPQIIEGELLAKRRDKNLDGKGMKFPGGVSMMNP